MSKESFVFLLGATVLMSAFLGIPREFKEWLLILCGILLMGVGYRLRRDAFLRSLQNENGERKADAFVENVVYQETDVPPHKDSRDYV